MREAQFYWKVWDPKQPDGSLILRQPTVHVAVLAFLDRKTTRDGAASRFLGSATLCAQNIHMGDNGEWKGTAPVYVYDVNVNVESKPIGHTA